MKIKGNEEFSIRKELPKLKLFSVTLRITGKMGPVWNLQFGGSMGIKPSFLDLVLVQGEMR